MGKYEKVELTKDSTIEEVRADKGFIGHPRGVGALAFGNFANSAAWGAFYAVMIFYLYAPYSTGLGYTEGQAALMITAMGACNGLFVILGSWLSDRVLGMRKALVVGNIVKGTGFLLVALPVTSLEQGRLFAILSLILLSLPVMGASNNSLTGQLYDKSDNGRRDAAFTIHQFANTIAGVFTPIIVGQLSIISYHIGFAIAALFAFAYGAIIYFARNKFFGTLGDKPVKPLPEGELKKIGIKAGIIALVGIIAIAIIVGSGIAGLDVLLNVITSLTFIIPIVFFVSLYKQKDLTSNDKKRMRPFFKLFTAQVLLSIGATLLTTAIAIFIDQKINRMAFGIEIAPGTIPVIYTILGLILGPIFIYFWASQRGQKISVVKKYSFGILMASFAFGVLAIPNVLFSGNAPFSIWWIIIYYLFMSISDQCIWPIGSSVTSKLSPENYETQMQTAWGQAAAIANGICLILFRFFQTAEQQTMLFPIIFVMLLITSIVLFINSKSIDGEMA